ncbi:MAG TPA: helical backbone metal receptor [Thermoanaerobaculia bacterium]|nr:helical backbone metal receptor [Thermoanaerobaculia bacterium]
MRRLPLLLALLLAVLGGCRQEARPPEPKAAAGSCQRVIALTPSLVETLFALGLGDRVAGVGDYSTWPPEVEKKPHLGGLFNPNLEQIVALKPDLAVLIPSEGDLAARLKPLGVDVLVVQNESLADVERSFHTIAERCGVAAAGERLAAEWREGLKASPLPGPPPRVMLSVGRQAGKLGDLIVAGKGTFFHELLERLGAKNAFADAAGLYPQISLEEIVARRPDVILELRAYAVTPEVAASLEGDWRELGEAGNRVEVLAGDYVVIPGPRLPRLYREMREALVRRGE